MQNYHQTIDDIDDSCYPIGLSMLIVKSDSHNQKQEAQAPQRNRASDAHM